MTLGLHGPISVIIETGEVVPNLPLFTSMSNVYPNPVQHSANFDVQVKEGETANLRIFNVRGQVIKEYLNIPSDFRNIVWDRKDTLGREVSSGVYFYKLTSPSVENVRRMILMK